MVVVQGLTMYVIIPFVVTIDVAPVEFIPETVTFDPEIPVIVPVPLQLATDDVIPETVTVIPSFSLKTEVTVYIVDAPIVGTAVMAFELGANVHPVNDRVSVFPCISMPPTVESMASMEQLTYW